MPSRLLSNHISPKDVQAIPFELNLRKEKWMLVFIYRPPKQGSQYFLGNVSLIIDHYSSIYENHIILGDFNMESKKPKLASFMHPFNLYNLIKSNTCFKGSGSCPKKYKNFEKTFENVLDAHAPKKTKLLNGNHKPHISKSLRKAIMKRFQLIEQNNLRILLNIKNKKIW